ncbi:MAG: hypothetical protein PW788_14695 [Micavibrio sp.]|nr:hypothetical protein [Micavibrio sp.]
MLYGRPDITPLNWDLQALPEFNGGYTFHARMVDDKSVWFIYRFGFLSAGYGATAVRDESILKKRIAPIGFMEILPEQLCDILGLTVRGEKVALSRDKLAEQQSWGNVFDFSGDATWWESEHMIAKGDREDFIDAFKRVFPSAVLLQYILNENRVAGYREINAWTTDSASLRVFVEPVREEILKYLSFDGTTTAIEQADLQSKYGFNMHVTPESYGQKHIVD